MTAQTGSSGPGFQLPNPALHAESSLTMETGVRVDSGRRLSTTGLIYRARIDGFIGGEAVMCPLELEHAGGDAAAVFRATNAGSAEIRGIGSPARARTPTGLSVIGSATTTRPWMAPSSA